MAWKEKNAIKRIYNTFKRLKSGIYTEDAEALKTLNEWLENESANFVDDNRLFAKVLCINLRQNLHYYGDINLAIKTVRKEIELPLSHHIEMLRNQLNYLECTKTIEANESLTKDQFLAALDKWNHKNIEESFYKTANDILKDPDSHS